MISFGFTIYWEWQVFYRDQLLSEVKQNQVNIRSKSIWVNHPYCAGRDNSEMKLIDAIFLLQIQFSRQTLTTNSKNTSLDHFLDTRSNSLSFSLLGAVFLFSFGNLISYLF